MSRIQDLASLLKSLQLITEACARLKAKNIQFIWANSSLRYAAENCKEAPTFEGVSSADIAEGIGRVNTVLQGIKVYTTTTLAQKTGKNYASAVGRGEITYKQFILAIFAAFCRTKMLVLSH